MFLATVNFVAARSSQNLLWQVITLYIGIAKNADA